MKPHSNFLLQAAVKITIAWIEYNVWKTRKADLFHTESVLNFSFFSPRGSLRNLKLTFEHVNTYNFWGSRQCFADTVQAVQVASDILMSIKIWVSIQLLKGINNITKVATDIVDKIMDSNTL